MNPSASVSSVLKVSVKTHRSQSDCPDRSCQVRITALIKIVHVHILLILCYGNALDAEMDLSPTDLSVNSKIPN